MPGGTAAARGDVRRRKMPRRKSAGHQIRNYVLAPYQLGQGFADQRRGKGNPDAVLDGDLDEFMAAALAARRGDAQ